MVQAGQGYETMVLRLVAASLAIVVVFVATLHLVHRLAIGTGPGLGDHVAVAGPAPGFAWDVSARLPTGQDCQIGLGRDAGAGGELYVVSRGPDGDVNAIWSSTGRSTAKGPDCGNGASVKIDRATFSQLANVAHGINPTMPMDNSVAF